MAGLFYALPAGSLYTEGTLKCGYFKSYILNTALIYQEERRLEMTKLITKNKVSTNLMTKNKVPFDRDDPSERVNFMKRIYCYHHKAKAPEELDFIETYASEHPEEMETIDKKYRDWVWKAINTKTGEVWYMPSFTKRRIDEILSEKEKTEGLTHKPTIFLGQYEVFTVRTSKMEVWDGNLVIRLYNYRVGPNIKMGQVTRNIEFMRVIVTKKDGVYMETNSSFNPYSLNSFFSKGMLPYLETDTITDHGSSADVTRFIKDYCEMELPYVSLKTAVFLMKRTPQNGRIFKNVPEAVVKDLDTKVNPRRKGFRKEAEQCGLIIPRHYYGYSQIGLDVKAVLAETENPDFVLLRGFSDNGIERERIYATDKEIYCFVWDNPNKRWVSRSLRYMTSLCADMTKFFMYAHDDDGDVRLTSCISEYTSYLKLKNAFMNTPIKCANIQKNDMYMPLNGYYLYKTAVYAEQAVKIGKPNLFSSICACNVKRSRENMTEILGLTSGLLKYIADDVRLENIYEVETFRAFMKNISFRDRVFQTDIAGYIAKMPTAISNIKSLMTVYEKNGKDIEPTLKAMWKQSNFPYEFVQSIRDYMDYIRVRKDAEKLGNFKYPEVIKPSEIKFMHDKATRDYNCYQQLANARKENKIFMKAVENREYTGLIYEDGDFNIQIPATPDDLIFEGRELGHCVGSYVGKVATGDSMICFLRNSKAPDKPYYTIEVVPNRVGNRCEMIQCFGAGNTIDTDENRQMFIRKWCKEKRISIKCRY